MAKKQGSCFGSLIKFMIAVTLIAVLLAVTVWYFSTKPLETTKLKGDELKNVEDKVKPVVDRLIAGQSVKTDTLLLSEHEINGYIDHASKYGEGVHLDLQDGYIDVLVYQEAPKNVPIFGGKKVRAKCKMYLSVENNKPHVSVSDVKAFGLPLPKKWIKDYVEVNLYPKIKRKLALEKDITQVSAISIMDNSISIEFNQ